MRTCAVLLLVAWSLATPAAADRGRVTYRAREGDSLALIAAETYGERSLAPVLATANRLAPPVKLRPGQALVLPVPGEIVTAPGDTLAGLAAQHLDDARRGEALAQWNRVPLDARLPAGTVLRIAAIVTVTAPRAMTVDELIAEAGLAGASAKATQAYNFLDGGALAAGDVLRVALPAVTLVAKHAPRRAADAQARVERQATMMAALAGALPTARAAWRTGDYATVKRELTTIDRAFVPTSQSSEAGVLLASAYVALGDLDSAVATLAAVRERAPALRLDAYHHAPAVLAAWQAAGGEIAAAP